MTLLWVEEAVEEAEISVESVNQIPKRRRKEIEDLGKRKPLLPKMVASSWARETHNRAERG